VLLLGLCGDLASMVLLALSPLLMGAPAAFFLLCVATAALGLGFGAAVMALNTLVEGFFPGRADGAVLALNALLGLGTALAPVLVAVFTGLGMWWALPLLMTVLLVLLLAATLRAPLRLPYATTSQARTGLPPRFWIYAAAVLLYGVAETLCGNWATLYLSTQRGLSVQNASLALTSFWVMVTVGRIVIAFLDRLISARWIYLGLPWLLLLIFQFIARAEGVTAGIVGFAAAGLACSAFLPLSISFAGTEFPLLAATVSGELIAFYQLGYGLAAFGVGPLKTFGGLAYSAVFSLGSIVAFGLAAATLLVVRHRGSAKPTPAVKQ
jgi:fucose permease